MQDAASTKAHAHTRKPRKKITVAQKEQMRQLRTTNKLTGYNISKIMGIPARTIYSNLRELDIDTIEFNRVKKDWPNLVRATSAKTLSAVNRVLDSLSDKDICALTADQKATAYRNLCVGMGAALDQAPKISTIVNIDVGAITREISQLQAEIVEMEKAIDIKVIEHDSSTT